MKELKDFTDQELMEEYQGLVSCIEDTNCFGLSDLTRQLAIEKELESRGYTAIQRTIIEWAKENDE